MNLIFKFFFSLCIFSLASMNTCIAQESANYGAPKFDIEDGKKLLIMGQDLGGVGGLNGYTEGYVDKITDHLPSGVTTYTSLPELSGLKTKANWGAGDVWGQAYLNDETFDNSFVVIGLYLVDRLDAINNGTIDAKIKEFAQWVKLQNRPIFIRIGYEFEGPWNNYEPEKFKKAWKHIVHVFDEQEVKNAAYVWQSAGLNYNTIQNWYPGDEYVNWLGYSLFDGPNPGQSMRNFANLKNKPIMIAEATPKRDLKVGSGQVHWGAWYEKAFNTIYGNDKIKAFAYINTNWDAQSMWIGQGWGDSRVHVNDYVKTKWIEEINKPVWLTATDELFDDMNYQNWISTSTNEVDELKPQLVISDMPNQIIISTSDQTIIDEISLLHIDGRLMNTITVNSNEYSMQKDSSVPQLFIVQAKIANQLISKVVGRN